jgi:hypothetical protein
VSIPALLLIAAVAHLAPDHIADLLGQSPPAWEYVLRGIEGVALWGIAGTHYKTPEAFSIAAYGMWESAQLSACRAAHSMFHAPLLEPGQGLCTAAGWPVGYWAPVIVAVITFALALKLAKSHNL